MRDEHSLQIVAGPDVHGIVAAGRSRAREKEVGPQQYEHERCHRGKNHHREHRLGCVASFFASTRLPSTRC